MEVVTVLLVAAVVVFVVAAWLQKNLVAVGLALLAAAFAWPKVF